MSVMDPDSPSYGDDALVGARECDYCHEAREDVRRRRWLGWSPAADTEAYLCRDCWLDVQGG